MFINALVRRIEEPNYLEIGSWKGSTLCAAIVNNSANTLCIDNWSEFGGPKDVFKSNVKRALTDDSSIEILDKDFRKINFESLKLKFNIYFFDGPHTFDDHYEGIVVAYPSLQDTFVLLVDDYNWHEVRAGTKKGIETMNLEVLASITITTNSHNKIPNTLFRYSDWHNGYFFAILRKQRSV